MTTVLVVESDRTLRDVASSWLGAQGYDLVTARSGGTAVRLIAETRPDVVVLRLGLPDLDAPDAIKAVRTFSTVPLLVLAASEPDIPAALEAGADDYLLLPYDPIDLLDRVRELAATRADAAALPEPRAAGRTRR